MKDRKDIPADAGESMDFEAFRRNNRRKVNRSLNIILWICILAGPAIALGILGGVFKQTSYTACLIISASMTVTAAANMLLLRRRTDSYVPGIVALLAVEILLCYMNASHISIRLTWFLVPLLSLLFCEKRVYIGISLVNFVAMGVGTWLEAPHYAEIRTDFTSVAVSFINVYAGCFIEALIMFAAGYALGKATGHYYRRMMGQYDDALKNQAEMREQLEILESMSQIYDYVNLIDFTESTEMSLREENLHKLTIEKGQNHTHMTQGMRDHIAPDMVDDFWKFTDITTVPLRLVNHKSIAGEFVSTRTGWFRAQYIRVRGKMDREPEVVIYTVQNIDADKRREEHLIRISMTDELTRVYNRRCYDDDIDSIHQSGIADGLALISADVNGLKRVNDTLGHGAGDELIKGAATCLLTAVGPSGKVYRTGGDEFMAIVYSVDCAEMISMIKAKAAAWHGFLTDSISISAGFADSADHPEADIEELERLADQCMYDDKARYYKESGHDRRHR